MNSIFRVSLLLIIALCFFACKSAESKSESDQQPQTIRQQNSSPQQSQREQPAANAGQPSSSNAEQPIENEVSIYDIFTKEDSLSYQDYEISIGSKRVVHLIDGETYPQKVSCSILKKGGKVIKRFECGHFSSSSSNFGLFNFTGGKNKQLVVANTLSKSGRFWIVGLHPAFRILLDTSDYGECREEPGIIDIDKDGTYEMVELIWDFMGVKPVATVNTPQPVIIFKYDKNANRYLPANHILQNYSLRDIEDDIKKLSPDVDSSDINSTERHYYERVSILLQYIFAGKEKEGWVFFEQSYNLPDKREIKMAIKSVLRKQPAYRFIYRKNTNHRT